MTLLAPLFMAFGIIVYYQLPFEPWLPAMVVGLVMWGIMAMMLRRKNIFVLVVAGWWLLFGLALSGWHGYFQKQYDIAPDLRADIFSIKFLRGQVSSLESSNSDHRVVIFKVTEVDDAPTKPFLVRLTDPRKLLGEDSFQGNVLPLACDMTIKAQLFPLPLKSSLNSYDLGRDWYFHGYRAGGQLLATPLVDGLCDVANSTSLGQKIKNDIIKNYPPDAGGMVLAMITGDRSGISSALMEQYRQSGLIHLISISGVHMGLIAGMAFLLLRWGLLLVRPNGDGYLFKKIAAAGAMGITIFYFLLADYSSASLRAALTTVVAFVGVMLGRRAISLENLAISMLLVLCYRSCDLFNPGFQLSFSAMLVLVGIYEKFWQPMLVEIEAGIFFRQKPISNDMVIFVGQAATTKKPPPTLFKKLQVFIFALLVSGTMISIAALPISLFHFHQSSLFGIVANMAAIPLMDSLAMPLLFIKVLLLPITSHLGAFYPLDFLITKIFQSLNWMAENLHGSATYLIRGGQFGRGALFFYGLAFYLFVVGGAGLKKISYIALSLFLLLAVAAPQPWLVVAGLEPGGRPKWLARVDSNDRTGTDWVSPFGNSFVRRLWMQEYGIDNLEKSPPPPSVCSRDMCQMVWPYHGGQKFTATILGGNQAAGKDGDEIMNSPLVKSLCAASDIIIGQDDTPKMRAVKKTCPEKIVTKNASDDTATLVISPLYGFSLARALALQSPIIFPLIDRITLRPRPWVMAAMRPGAAPTPDNQPSDQLDKQDKQDKNDNDPAP